MSREGWELLFMMLVLKIPIAYLAFVVWYAIKAEPEPVTDIVGAGAGGVG